MRYNALAFMALVNGLAQANRFDWQSESKANVAKHEHKNAADPVFKVEVNKGQLEAGKLKKEGEKAEQQAKKLEEKLQKKEDELELKAAQAGGNRHHHHSHSSYSPDSTYDPATKTTGYHHHHSGHLQKGPYTLDGEKYDYIHKPKVHFHTSYTTHAPTLSPGCVGDKCSRKPYKECHGNWAQPGCWHCKALGATGEEVAEQAAKTTKHAPKETKAKEEEEEEEKKEKDPHAKTYTHGDKTVIVPKETKAPEATRPEAPQIEQPHKEGPKVIVIEDPKKKPEEKKSEEEKEEKEKYHDEKPKHEFPKEKPKEEPKHEHPKEEPKKEDICDKVHHHGQPSICDKIKHQHHKVDEPKKKNICSKPKGCHPHQAPAPA
ncbi:cyclin-dependent kinase inhibitor 1c, partial [Fusarium sp. NRRL 25303]